MLMLQFSGDCYFLNMHIVRNKIYVYIKSLALIITEKQWEVIEDIVWPSFYKNYYLKLF
jgi:hypothetical protein